MANKENMRKWVAALRSGKFKQGRRALTNDGKFCCLGVACEAAIMDGVPLVKEFRSGVIAYDYHSTSLPARVREWLGITEPDPIIERYVDGDSIRAIQANDALGWPFDVIAAHIERYYELKDDDASAHI